MNLKRETHENPPHSLPTALYILDCPKERQWSEGAVLNRKLLYFVLSGLKGRVLSGWWVGGASGAALALTLCCLAMLTIT